MKLNPNLKTILFLGSTGSGKGVQSKLLSEKTGFKVFSTGGRYRELRVGDSHLAARIRQEYDAGLLLPSWFSTFLFQEAFMYLPPEEGIICEGIGRTLQETENFDSVMDWLGRSYVVFCLNITEEESMRRQMARRSEEHRPESDTAEKIQLRFAEFHAKTAPAIEFLRSRGKVVDIDGERSIEEVHADVLAHLGK